jgi:HAE1 family hydrophobic/amphiphilic exporter-1
MNQRSPAVSEHTAEMGEDGGFMAVFVRRPVLTIVLNLLIVIAGVAAYFGVEIRELPNIDQPVITIRTVYTGATPETIDKEVTAVIEGAVARAPGVTSISSESEPGQGQVQVEFGPSTDINVAAADLRDAVANLRSLPTDPNFSPPTIVKADTNSDQIMRIAATSATMSIEDLTQLVNDRVVPKLAAVDGVADVQLSGDRSPIMRIIIKPDALAARHLTIGDLNTALGSIATNTPAGSVSDPNRTLLVRADMAAKAPEEIAALPITPSTRVGDVADVVLGAADKTTILRINGSTGVGIGIVRQAKSNTLSISNRVRTVVDQLNASLPKNIKLNVTSDDAIFIGGSIREVLLTLLLATSIVVGVIYVFLRSVRTTFIPAIAVPITLIGTLAAIWVVGFSINLLTLLALVLATGLVVDDAIVVIENITRHRALGYGAWAAAVLGTRQVFFAVLSTTATLAAVFVPISFFPGVAGRLFSEFGFVLAFAVILSAFVALTLSPMLAARFAGGHQIERSTNPLGRALTAFGNVAVRTYTRALDACLGAPFVVVLVALLFAGAALIASRYLPQELSPPEDRGIVQVRVTTPQGATIDYTDEQMRKVEAATDPLLRSGEATAVFSVSRSNGDGGFLFITLAPWDQRTRTQMAITAQLSRSLQPIPGIQVSTRTSNSLGIRGGGQGLRFAVTGPDYASLTDAADNLTKAMEKDPTFGDVSLDFDTTQPQISVMVDRQRAEDVGVTPEAIAAAVQTLLSGHNLGNFYKGEDAIKVRTEVPVGMIQDINGLDSIQLRTSTGKMVPMSSLVTFEESAVSPNLPRQDQRRALPMTASLANGVDLKQAITHLGAIAERILPPEMGIVFTGEAKALQQTSGGVLQTFAFAVLIVLLVLAAQFESFNSALILFATVPFGLAAAVFAILLTGGSINIYSEIGLVMLVGIMSKNGILIVEFANQLRDRGASVDQAIRDACMIRLRPVVMTMIATVLGGLPLVLRSGAGSEARHALGWIIVGGLGFATIFTLFLTPVVFSLLARFSKPRAAGAQRLADELGASTAPVSAISTEPTGEELPVAAE